MDMNGQNKGKQYLIDDLFKILMVRIKVNHMFLFVKKHTETAQDTDSLVGV